MSPLQRPWLQRVVVAGAAILVFVTSLPVPFIYWDDPIYVTGSARTQTPGLAGIAQVWDSSAAWQGQSIEFFPLRDTAYWAVWQLFGGVPAAFHALSILVHLGVALLLLELGVAMGLSREIAFWAALLFAVHPIHVESVTWVSGLKDPMFSLLMVGSVLSFVRYRREQRPLHYVLCVVLMLGALLTKSVALVTPVLLLAFDRLLPGASWRDTVKRVAGPAALSALFLVQFVLIGKANGVLNPPHGGSWGQHLFLMSWAFARYVQQAFLPATFRIHYCFPNLESAFDPRLLGIAAVLGVVVAVALFARRQKVAALLLVWFLACLAPVANLIPFPAIMADRYLYAPSIAACLALSWGLSSLSTRLQNPVRVAVVVVFSLVTLSRGVFWQREGNLWAEAVEDDACLEDRLVQAAVMYFKHGEWIQETDPTAALVAYRKGLGHPAFRELDATSRANYLTGGAFAASQRGERGQARAWEAEAVAIRPDAATLWELGEMRLRGQQLQGVEQLAVAVQLEPSKYCPRLLTLLAAAPSLRQGRLGELGLSCAAPP